MARFVSAYSGGASGEKVLGSMMVFRKAQLVSIPSSFTSAIDPGLLPDRQVIWKTRFFGQKRPSCQVFDVDVPCQTLLLGQLANFKDSGLRGTSPSPIGCKHNLAAAIMVGDPLQECYGR